MPAASPEASDWCVSPFQKDEKSSSEYGLAMKNASIETPSAISSPRTALALPVLRGELGADRGDDRQQDDAAGVLRRTGDPEPDAGDGVVAQAAVAQDPGRPPQRQADAHQRRHVVERKLGVEDRQERDREDAGREQADAAVDEPRAGEVQQPDRDRPQQRRERARDDPDLRRVGGERVRHPGATAEPDAEHHVHEVRVGRRVDVVVGVPAVAEEPDRARHEVRVLVGVVGVRQAVADAPDAQDEGEQQQRADGQPPDEPLVARPAQVQQRGRQQAAHADIASRIRVGIAELALNS